MENDKKRTKTKPTHAHFLQAIRIAETGIMAQRFENALYSLSPQER